MRYRFGQYCFDTDAHELSCDGEAIHLPPKVFGLLHALLERRPKALSRDELHELLWPGVHVSDASLARVASDLRRALGENADESEFIRTLHGFGYAFVGEVREDMEEALDRRHMLTWKRRRIFLRPGDNILGRDPESVLFVDAAEVSRRHCRIRVDGAVAILDDLGSKNGTYVQGKKLTGPVELAVGDVIEVGSVLLVYGESGDTSTVTHMHSTI